MTFDQFLLLEHKYLNMHNVEEKMKRKREVVSYAACIHDRLVNRMAHSSRTNQFDSCNAEAV